MRAGGKKDKEEIHMLDVNKEKKKKECRKLKRKHYV